MTTDTISTRVALIYRNDGMHAHAALEEYLARWHDDNQQWALDMLGDGMRLAFRLLAANAEAIGPLAMAIKAEDIGDPYLPSDPEEWEATYQREAERLLARWEGGNG